MQLLFLDHSYLKNQFFINVLIYFNQIMEKIEL